MSSASTDILSQEAATPQENAAEGNKQQHQAKTALGRLTDQWKGNTLVPLMIGGAAVIALAAAFFMWASTPPYRVLFSNLSEADGGRIINELDSRGIPYELSAGGQSILVPGDQVHGLRLRLAEQGLPHGGSAGFEIMDNQSFGISQFAEQVNYQRSLEGELSRSIESMSPVSTARVHLSMPKPSVFIRDREPAKASVVLTMQSGRSLARSRVDGIIHLVSSSVPELDHDNVTVVDQEGNLLSENDLDTQLDGDQLNYTQEVERRYRERIENILTPLFGEDNFSVQVAADMDFSTREETLESYGPNRDGAAVRSSQQSGALDGDRALAQGIPGALSNAPPDWTPAQIEQAEQEEGAGPAAAAGQEGAEGNLSYDNLVNYEVDRNITHIQHQKGRIDRLSVAAAVNYRPGVDEEGNAIMEPLGDEQMEQVTALIRQAMGFSAARGDQLEVINSQFVETSDAGTPEPAWWTRPGMQDMILTLTRYLLAALFALGLYRLILRPLLRRHVESTSAQAVAAAGGDAGSLSGPDQAKLEAAKQAMAMPSPEEVRRRRERKSTSYQHDLQELRQMAKDDPRLVAMVVRSWINKG